MDPHCTKTCPIRVQGDEKAQLAWIPTAEIQMLGVSLGSDEKVAAFVESKIFAKLIPMVERLSDFDDLQSAFFLLRVSFTIVRATHFMRTTPLNQWRDQAVRFDGAIRRAAESIFGAPFNNQSYTQAALTPRLGGQILPLLVDTRQIASDERWLSDYSSQNGSTEGSSNS